MAQAGQGLVLENCKHLVQFDAAYAHRVICMPSPISTFHLPSVN